MTHEEKMDLVLSALQGDLNGFTHAEIIEKVKHEINHQELAVLLTYLEYTEGIIFYNGWGKTYVTRPKGTYLLKNGGFAERKKREDEMYQNSIDSLRIAKETYQKTEINTRWVIAGSIAAIVGVLLTLIFYFIDRS